MTASQSTHISTHRFCTAPMLAWTNKHCRHLWRQMSQHAVLYSEMITTGALIHGNRTALLQHQQSDAPVALQLGGSDPAELALCASMAQDWAYTEVNLNVGCPSARTQRGQIGACLMAKPNQVRIALQAMRDAVDIDVSIKHRLGIDDQDSWQALVDFVGTVAESGCTLFIIHARKAFLSGLSPKENRTVPPVRYDWVHRLKILFPQLTIIINAELDSISGMQDQLSSVDGVMVGRALCTTPWLLTEVDTALYGAKSKAPITPMILLKRLLPYVEAQLQQGERLSSIVRSWIGLFHGQPGARIFRRWLSKPAHDPCLAMDHVRSALQAIDEHTYLNN